MQFGWTGFKLAGIALVSQIALASGTLNGYAEANKEIVFAGYGGVFEEFIRSLMPKFEAETGIKVKLIVGSGLGHFASIQNSRNNPEIDVYWAGDLTHAAGKALGLYEKLDPSIVTNLADVQDVARDPDDIGVTSQIAAVGLLYNPSKFAQNGIAVPDSWNALWDPKLKGRVVLQSISITFSQDFLAAINRVAGGGENDVGKGIARIKELQDMGNVGMIANSPAEAENAMLQENAWIGYTSTARAFILKDQGAPVDFALPKEGGVYYGVSLDVIKGAPNPEAAQKWVNFMLSPYVQEQIATKLNFAPVNHKVDVPADFKGRIPSTAEEFSKLMMLDRSVMNEKLDDWVDQWNREIASH